MSHGLTGKELAERRKRKKEEEIRRIEEEKERMEAEAFARQERLKIEQQQREQLDLLQTFHTQLYNEIDKLNKKAPKEQVSNYTLLKVNEHIARVKSFLPSDPYLSEIHLFEPAGDNPEYRDVSLALAQIGASLGRFRKKLSDESDSSDEFIKSLDLDILKDFKLD